MDKNLAYSAVVGLLFIALFLFTVADLPAVAAVAIAAAFVLVGLKVYRPS